MSTLSELIGSSLIFGFRGASLDDAQTRENVETLKAAKCKGIILFDHDIAGNCPRNIENPAQLTQLIEDLRHELGEDLIVSVDQEGGQVARLKASSGFAPSESAAELATWEEQDLRASVLRMAMKMNLYGIDLNLAPCVDLSVEPLSPIIAEKERSFGRDHDTVVRCASMFIEMHRTANVACCIKHYPGHGSSLIDTHHGLSDITKTHQRDEERVFGTLIDTFGDSIAVMPGHLVHQGVDENLPASLSPAHLKGVLRTTLRFDGPIISDSLDMRAVRLHCGDEGEASLLALMAGCDLIVDGFNAPGYREPGGVQRIVNTIGEAIRSGRWGQGEQALTESRERVDRLLSREKTR
ncbi:MAG: glycoside hydrolase family 3 protein [Erythrobacter sp.]|nr:glycoside hydrolase family 3 protein [Erythrobacter sp.]